MVDLQRILDIGMKVMNLTMTLAKKGEDISTVVKAGTNIFSKKIEDVTEADLNETERVLDLELDKAERPMTRKA